MRQRRLFWQLFPAFLIVTLASVAALSGYAITTLGGFHERQIEADLSDYARLVEGQTRDLLAQGDRAAIRRFCEDRAGKGQPRLTVIGADGVVLGDTAEDPDAMENHADRPEIAQARRQGIGTSRRFSHTIRSEQLYVAIALPSTGGAPAFVRVSIPASRLEEPIRALYGQIALACVAIVGVAAAVSWVLSRRLAQRIEELRHGAERFARGELAHKLPVSDTEELGMLAESLNRMAASLDERIHALVRQRNEGNAVLASMVEGVIAVDTQERVISMNQACARLLGTDAAKIQGRSLQEVVRNPDLQQLVACVLAGQEPINEEITLHQQGQWFLEAHGTVLRDAGGREIGVLVVLHDVTRVRKLENVRRDFVANVSHELRTPITSIKGFVETLLDGALDDPEDARRFLKIIAAQTDRLGAIIEDLLMLSRIEQEHEKAEIGVEPGRIRPVMESAIGVCQLKANEKRIQIELGCEQGLEANINPTLLEQALVNLIDNAIKYSVEGGTISLEAETVGEEIELRVRDHGCGIPREHLSRIFERFYRVDKARSRKLGGTGLGLAIVKHIAQSHGGRATVSSALGEGSTFTLHLPAKG